MAPFRRKKKFPLGRAEESQAGRDYLNASGFKINRKDAETMRRLPQLWQAKAFAYYDLLGEIKYAASFYSRSLAALRLYVGKLDEQGEVVEVDSEPDIQEFLERIRDPGGGRSNLLASYGRLMFLAGECMLFVSKNPDTEEEQWEMLSTDELRFTGSSYVRYAAPSLPAENFSIPSDDDYEPVDDKSAVAYRFWKRHPRYSMTADSTMQGVLELCEELLLLTQAVRARARSRLAGSGILFVSDDFGPPPLDTGNDEDPNEDVFLEALTDAMTAPIIDEGTASAIVPLVVRGSTDAIKDGVRHLQIIDPTQLYPETGLRMECIKRIAIGLDMPPEVLLGVTDANHWSAWQVDESAWKAHLLPVAQQLVDDLTSAYLRPALKAAGVNNWQDYVVAFDAAAVINHPDRSKDAKDLYDRRAIGKETLREAAGFDDDDSPSEEELDEMIGIEVRDASMAKFGIPSPKSGTIEPVAGELVDKAGTVGPNEVAKVPPVPPNERAKQEEPPGVLASLNGEALAAKIIGASDLAMQRAREQAGNRIRAFAKRDPESEKLIDGLRAGQIAFTLGPERVRAMRCPGESQLVEGASGLLAEALKLWGVENPAVAELLGERIEQHAARTLYEERPSPLPPTFYHYVAGLKVDS